MSRRPTAKHKPVQKAVGIGGPGAVAISRASLYDAVSNSNRRAETAQTMDTYWMLFTRHPHVRTCVTLISEAVSSEGFSIVPVSGDRRKPVGKATANAVMSRNPRGADVTQPTVAPRVATKVETTFDQPDEEADPRLAMLKDFFRVAFVGTTMPRVLLATAVDLTVFAVSYWRKKRVGKLVVALERLDPRRVIANVNEDRTMVTSFTLRKTSGNGGIDPLRDERIPATDVIMFTTGGGDPLFGAPSPLEALDMTIAGDIAIRTHREAFFRNGATSGLILVNELANEEQIAAAVKQTRRTKEGAENAYTSTILPGTWKVHQTTQAGGHDLDFLKGSEANRDEIFGVYRVPPGKVFNMKGALGQAGKQQDDVTFQRDAVLPIERSIYETLTIELLDKEFKITDLHLVPKRLNALRLDMIEAAKAGVSSGMTGNEARDLVGLPLVLESSLDMDVPLFLGYKQPFADMEVAAGGDAGASASKDPALDVERAR